MSTILDALRKAQEETGDKRQPPVGEHPVATEAVTTSPRARRRIGWPVAVAGILALAFAGGLAFGDRIAALLGSGADDAPPAPADAQVAARSDAAPAAPDVKQKSEEPTAAAPKMRRGKPRADGKAPASDQPVVRTQGQAAAPEAGAAAAPAAMPTPYGQLHVFGAGERPAGNKPTNEDRLARLQQLRDKMLKARQEAATRGPQAEAPAAPAQIFVPPPREAAPAQAAAPKTDTPAAPKANEAARGATGEPAEIAPPAEPAHDAPVEVARADVPPPADVPAAAPAVDAAEPAVGVSVTNAHAEAAAAAAAEAEVQDPDIPPPHEPAAAAPEPPTTVAAVAPAQPAPAAAARAAAAAPQVLRRAPGGAPQVAINILQWSAEPGRRFAFVSVDGGNMTQVREGDHIAGLTIKHIHQQMIEFGFNDSTFLLRAN